MDKYKPAPIEEEFYLALESIIRWTNRQGYPSAKIKAIREVAGAALLRIETEKGLTFTPHYQTIVGAELPNLAGLNPNSRNGFNKTYQSEDS